MTKRKKSQASFSGKLPPKRVTNASVRPREYLTEKEVEKLVAAAKGVGRHGLRDSTLILVSYRHGLRVSEAVTLRWDMVELDKGRIHVKRMKAGLDSVHPLRAPELRALRKLKREYPDSPYLFVGERGGPITDSSARKIIARAGELSGINFPVHPHMLRHACGFTLANRGHDTRAIQAYLGHKNIQHTVRYTELSSERFNDFWRG